MKYELYRNIFHGSVLFVTLFITAKKSCGLFEGTKDFQ